MTVNKKSTQIPIAIGRIVLTNSVGGQKLSVSSTSKGKLLPSSTCEENLKLPPGETNRETSIESNWQRKLSETNPESKLKCKFYKWFKIIILLIIIISILYVYISWLGIAS